MERITLRDYFDKMGYGKYTSRTNVGIFAERCGVSISVISRILRGTYEVKHHSTSVDKVNTILNKDGYELKLIDIKQNVEFMEEYSKLLEEENRILKEMLKEMSK